MFCPNCGSKRMGELDTQDEKNNPEGMTHYCKRCKQDFMIIWGCNATTKKEGEN